MHGTQNDQKLRILAQGGEGYPQINKNIKINKTQRTKLRTSLFVSNVINFLQKQRAKQLDVHCGIMKNGDKHER